MRILLVKPSPDLGTVRAVHRLIFLEPLELGYVAAAVPAEHDLRVADLRLARHADRRFKAELEDYKPDIMGISGYTHEVEKVKHLARTTRSGCPKAVIVVGGHHATVLPCDYNLDCFDAIVRGEGTAPFRAIVEAVSDSRPLLGIDNVLVPGSSFDERAAATLPHYPDLDTIVEPRRDLWDYRDYNCIWASEDHPDWKALFPPVALVRTSFGCYMNCSFCVVPRLCRRKHLCRSPARVAAEIAAVPADHVYFCDDETFIDPDHARDVAAAIKDAAIDKRYFAWARSTTVNQFPELFELWREIGLDMVFLGFEACSDDELRDISKRATVADNERAHATLRKMGIAVQAGFMVQPSFTEEDFARLGRYIRKMPPAQVTLTVYTPSPGSPAWDDMIEECVADPFRLHDCMHPLTRTSIPLKRFYKLFASLHLLCASKNPLRARRSLCKPWDVLRIWWAALLYGRAMKKAHRDYPVELQR